MANNETQLDIEKRALFYKMKRWKLGSIVVPLFPIILALLFIIFEEPSIQIIGLPLCSIFAFIRFSNKAKKLQNELNEKGGLSPESEKEYTDIFNKAWTKQFIIWFIIILIGAVVIYGSRNVSSKKSKYEDVFDKDPNTWTEDEKEYVNDFFEWQKKNSK